MAEISVPAARSLHAVLDEMVEAHAHEVAISVRDEGIGIATETLPQIFNSFEQRSTRSLDRAEGELGIRLALVKRLVELHGGSVHAESEGPGKGATSTVRLPRGVVDDAAL